MTNADLDRLDVLLSARDWAADLGVCEAATSGPWLSDQLWECRGLPLHEVPEFIVTSELPDENRTILFIACLRHTTQQVALNWPDEAPMDEGPVGLRECDAKMIAASREGWPAAIRAASAAVSLLAEVRRLRLLVGLPPS